MILSTLDITHPGAVRCARRKILLHGSFSCWCHFLSCLRHSLEPSNDAPVSSFESLNAFLWNPSSTSPQGGRWTTEASRHGGDRNDASPVGHTAASQSLPEGFYLLGCLSHDRMGCSVGLSTGHATKIGGKATASEATIAAGTGVVGGNTAVYRRPQRAMQSH